MKSKTIGLVILLLIVAVIAIALITKGNRTSEELPKEKDTVTEVDKNARRIDMLHSFVNGTHTIAGEINLPTPCQLLDTKVNVNKDGDEVVIAFSVIDETSEDEACAQVITANRFKEVFQANEDAGISATFEGEPAVVNLIPAEQDEVESYEVYLKG